MPPDLLPSSAAWGKQRIVPLPTVSVRPAFDPWQGTPSMGRGQCPRGRMRASEPPQIGWLPHPIVSVRIHQFSEVVLEQAQEPFCMCGLSPCEMEVGNKHLENLETTKMNCVATLVVRIQKYPAAQRPGNIEYRVSFVSRLSFTPSSY